MLVYPIVCSRDLDLDPMTLRYERDLIIFWRCTCTPKMTFLGQGFQKWEHEQDRQTHETECISTAVLAHGNNLCYKYAAGLDTYRLHAHQLSRTRCVYVLIVTHWWLKGRRDCRSAGPVKVTDWAGHMRTDLSWSFCRYRVYASDVCWCSDKKSSNSTTTLTI